MSRKSKIQDLSDPNDVVQANLFIDPSVNGSEQFFPPIHRDKAGFYRVLQQGIEEGSLGLDYEFSPATLKPTVIGIASSRECAAVRHSEELTRAVVEAPVVLVGHAVLDADRLVVDQMLGIKTPISKWRDSMLLHYIMHSDFAAAPGKEVDEDDSGALGLMGLWPAAAMATYLPVWKTCRGVACSGPCPVHSVLSYCAVDAFAGKQVADTNTARMREHNIPEHLYTHLQDLTILTHEMQSRGIKVDVPRVKLLDQKIKQDAFALFPHEKQKNRKVYGLRVPLTPEEYDPAKPFETTKFIPAPFNPQSPEQVIKYFDAHKIPLRGKGRKPTADKNTVVKALEKEAKKLGLHYDAKTGLLEGEYDELPEPVENLYKLVQAKTVGRGVKTWFDDRYLDNNGFLHPRFIVCGTSTGRIASSGPNCQNFKKGKRLPDGTLTWGAEVRSCIIPPEEGLCIIEADCSQLELRIVLWLAGMREKLGGDAFQALVDRSNGAFKSAAAHIGKGERDVAKIISHGSNYGMGLVILTDQDFQSRRIRDEIKAGALVVYDGLGGRPLWEFGGGVVASNGSHLAEMLFGTKSWEHRAMANQTQQMYFNSFPMIREWQMGVTKQVEKGFMQSVTGRFLFLYGDPAEDLKLSLAFLGQGTGAEYVQSSMVAFHKRGDVPFLQVHDSLAFYVPKDWTNAQCFKFMEPMCAEYPERGLAGFTCPVNVGRGENWYIAGSDEGKIGKIGV